MVRDVFWSFLIKISQVNTFHVVVTCNIAAFSMVHAIPLFYLFSELFLLELSGCFRFAFHIAITVKLLSMRS